MSHRNDSVTLIELLIAIVLLSTIAIGFSSIDIFSRHHVISSERRIKLQNDLSYAIETINKNFSLAFGNTKIDPVNDPGINDVVDVQLCGTNPVSDPIVNMAVYVEDINGDGRPTHYAIDRRIACIFTRYNHTLKFIPNYTGGCNPGLAGEVLSDKIVTFIPVFAADVTGNYPNYIDLEITACWDPDGVPVACGTPDNPSVTMRTRVKMPSVSTN